MTSFFTNTLVLFIGLYVLMLGLHFGLKVRRIHIPALFFKVIIPLVLACMETYWTVKVVLMMSLIFELLLFKFERRIFLLTLSILFICIGMPMLGLKEFSQETFVAFSWMTCIVIFNLYHMYKLIRFKHTQHSLIGLNTGFLVVIMAIIECGL